MARPSKWLTDTHQDQPVSSVARGAIRERLDLVWEFADLAAHRADADIEYVHQLRVSSRRANAALFIFFELLP